VQPILKFAGDAECVQRRTEAHSWPPLKLKLIVGFVIAAMLLLAMPQYASAQGIAYSTPLYFTVIYPYWNQAWINTTTGQPAGAGTSISVNGSYNVPAGYMGAVPVMYYSNGAVCRVGSWTYNGSASGGFGVITSPGCGAGPVYYSQGASRNWNGSGYVQYGTNASPDENS
jgi:hypothetical protein